MTAAAITSSSATVTPGAQPLASRHIQTNSENLSTLPVEEIPFEYTDFDPWSAPGVRLGYDTIVRSERSRATLGDGHVTLKRWDKKSGRYLPKMVSFAREDTDNAFYLREYMNFSDDEIALATADPATLCPDDAVRRDSMMISALEVYCYESSEIVGGFLDYIKRTKNAYLGFDYIDTAKNVVGRRYLKYTHRWSDEYRKKLVAKLYALDAGLKEKYGYNKSLDVTFVTLTTYQDGEYSVKHAGKRLSREEALARLHEGYRKLIDTIRKITKTAPYLAVLEPHWSGYGHIHLVIFAKLTDDDKERLQHLWSSKYGLGSKSHGIDIQDIRTKTIRSLTNYLMKYLTKTFFNGDTGTQYADPSDRWSPGELLFNAIVWYSGKMGVKQYRFLLPSREISQMMQRVSEKKTPKRFYFASWRYRMERTKNNVVVHMGEVMHRSGDTMSLGRRIWTTSDPIGFYHHYIKLSDDEKEKIDLDTLRAIFGARRDTDLMWFTGKSTSGPEPIEPDESGVDEDELDDVEYDAVWDENACRAQLFTLYRVYQAEMRSIESVQPSDAVTRSPAVE